MDFQKPVIVYTAETNVEAHMIVNMLHANGVQAYAVEDQSGVSIWGFGTISQYHKPNIWVDEMTRQKAAALIREFEQIKRARRDPARGPAEIQVQCERCGEATFFPRSLDGTTQECAHCGAYLDVGDLPWDDDFGAADD